MNVNSFRNNTNQLFLERFKRLLDQQACAEDTFYGNLNF